MPNAIRFLDTTSGRIDHALGSDSILPIDGRWSFPTIHQKALAHAASLRGLGKRYVGYTFWCARINSRACLSPIMFSMEEQQQLYGEHVG